MAQSQVDQILENINLDWSALIVLIAPELFDLGMEGVEDFLVEFGLGEADVDIVSSAVSRFARDRAAELVGMHWNGQKFIPSSVSGIAITEATRQMLRGTVERAIEEGWTASRIQHEVIENQAFSPQRALTIARTETAFARNKGSLESAKNSEVVKAKRWKTTTEACDICVENEAEGPIELDEDFESGDDCPPAHPNCRCILTYDTTYANRFEIGEGGESGDREEDDDDDDTEETSKGWI
ncbi:MAG: hypothetical protein KGL39_26720 [Patescibacteria group bacterium]|nr:hypothetical protein [Patescibacteria group bacterium]